MKQKFTLIISCFLISTATVLQAQEAVLTTGGEAGGAGGSSSYSVGQPAYITNTGAGGTVSEGVQQPFEILITKVIEKAKDITLETTVFPNPTSDFIKLKVDNYSLSNLTIQLYNISGSIIFSKKIDGYETNISMENQATGTYFLKVMDDNKEIKVFKIIKNK